MMDADPILAESIAPLGKLHDKRKDGPLGAFVRLVQKGYKGQTKRDPGRIDITKCRIRSERLRLSTAELVEIRNRTKDRSEDDDPPRCPERITPVIVAVFRGEEFLMDGNHRIVMWVEQGNPGPHAVNHHIIEEPASG